MHANDERPAQLLITVDEAARRLCIARSHLYLHLRSGTLPSVRIGRARRVAVADLEDFVDRLRGETLSRAGSVSMYSPSAFTGRWKRGPRRR
jgi:excisionase family DNA binding protein